MDTFFKNYIEYCNEYDNHYQVEISSLAYLASFPDDEYPYLALARLANKLGLKEHVDLFLKKAEQVNLNCQESELYKQCRSLSNSSNVQENNTLEKYIVINSNGAGLGADILYAVGWLYCSELTNRKPLIYWGENSIYNDRKNTNLFPLLFKGDALTDIEIAIKAKTNVFPEYWSKRSLSDYLRKTKSTDHNSQLRFEVTGSQYSQ